ncbi:MAG: P-loop NTPase fold protein [Pararobbsia sp.]
MSDSAHQEHRKLSSAEAAAFAQVIAAGGPAAPAAVALFGESSSSKSLFIDRLIATIGKLAKEPIPGQGRLATVRFSALPSEHGQLWAHFVEHLFAELKLGSATAELTSETDPLAAQLTAVFHLDDQAKRVLRARERVTRAEAAMERARLAYEAIYGKPIRNADKVRSDVTQEIFQARLSADKPKLARLARDLGVRTLDEDSLRMLMAEARLLFGRARMLAVSLMSIAKRRPLIFLVTTLLSILATAAATVSFDSFGVDMLAHFMPEPLARPLGDLGVAVTAAVVAFRIGLFGPGRAINYLRQLDKQIRMTVEREIGREQAMSSAKTTVLAKRESSVGDARQALMDAERELNEARAELAAATPGGNPGAEIPPRPPRLPKAQPASAAAEPEGASSSAASALAEEYGQNAPAPADGAGGEVAAAAEAGAANTDAAPADGAPARAESAAPAKPLAPVGRVVVILDGLDRCGSNALADALRAIDAVMTLPQFTVLATLDQERINKTLRRESDKRAIEQEEELGQQPRRNTDDFTPGSGATALSDDYLSSRFDTFYWVRDEVEPNLAHNSASVGAQLAELASDNDDEWWNTLGGNGEAEFAGAVEAVALVPAERKLLQKLDLVANQSSGGGQRLIHAYYLIKTALGPAAAEGFVGPEGERPHYRAVLAQLGFVCGMPRLFERYAAVQSMSARRNEDMHGLIMRLRRLHFDRIRGGGRYMEVLQMLEELDPGRSMVHALAFHANTAARFSLGSPDLVPTFDVPRERDGRGSRDEHASAGAHA